MPKRRCKFFDDEGNSVGRGCFKGTECIFIHPPGPEWDNSSPLNREQFESNRNSGNDSQFTWAQAGKAIDSGYGGRGRSSQTGTSAPALSSGTWGDSNTTVNAGDTSWGSWGATTSTENKVDNSEVWGSWGATTCTENKVDKSEVWGGSGGWGEANSGGTTEAHAEIVEKQVDEGIEGHGFKDDKRQANNPQRAPLVHDVNSSGVIKASDSEAIPPLSPENKRSTMPARPPVQINTIPIGPAARREQWEETLRHFMEAINAHHDLEESDKRRYGLNGYKNLLSSPQYAHTSQLACDLRRDLYDESHVKLQGAKRVYKERSDKLEAMPDPGPEFLDMGGQVDGNTLKRYADEMQAWLPDVQKRARAVEGRTRMAELHEELKGASEATENLLTRIDNVQELRKLDVRAMVKQCVDDKFAADARISPELETVAESSATGDIQPLSAAKDLQAGVQGVQVHANETELQLSSLQRNISVTQEQHEKDAEELRTLTAQVQRLLDSQPPPPLTLNPELRKQVDTAANAAVQQIAYPALGSIKGNILEELDGQQRDNWKRAWNRLQQPLALVEGIHAWLEGELQKQSTTAKETGIIRVSEPE